MANNKFPFRDITPTRRPNRKTVKNYNSYKKTLREDFNNRCGYCDDTDLLRIRNFTIDHFVPQNPRNFVTAIPPNDYYNLVYSCSYCNRAKSNKWPTNDEKKHNDGTIGFIDPVNHAYTNLFQRTDKGTIEPINSSNTLAHNIIHELKLWFPVHEKTWKLEKVKKNYELIRQKSQLVSDPKIKSNLEKTLDTLSRELQDLYSGIFAENE